MTMDFPLDPEDVWCEPRDAPAGQPRRALFLDRDGTVVEEVNYLHRRADVRLIPGAATVIANANEAGIPVVLVTNQSGIARGMYDWEDFQEVQETLDWLLNREGARLDGVYACAHHAEAAEARWRHPDHPARKPNCGMLTRAARDLDLDLSQSLLIGDALSDIQAARNAGLPRAVLVLTGHGLRDRAAAEALAGDGFGLAVANSMAALTQLS